MRLASEGGDYYLGAYRYSHSGAHSGPALPHTQTWPSGQIPVGHATPVPKPYADGLLCRDSWSARAAEARAGVGVSGRPWGTRRTSPLTGHWVGRLSARAHSIARTLTGTRSLVVYLRRKAGRVSRTLANQHACQVPATRPCQSRVASRKTPMLSPCTGARAAVDLLIGFVFLFGPELRITLWPAPLPPVLMRFIGPVVLGNDAGAWMVARQCS